MSLSRGEFLRSLGKSIPGMVLNSGAALAAQKLFTKMAAASGDAPTVPDAMTAPQSDAAMDSALFINRGPVENNQVALTFDDGPHRKITPRLLDELKKHGVHATFFMIGRHIAEQPELARRVLAEGHDIGNHTYTHPRLSTLPNDKADEEIRQTVEIIASVLNHATRWFRPPFGLLRSDQRLLPEKYGMKSVIGDIDTNDWSLPPEDRILAKIAEATSGSIIICHDFSVPTADCLGRALEELVLRGLQPVTLSNLFGTP
jgi:peptidoglycan/xylan/chitin deacetylase (PgdA/CDA1 family)